MTWIQKNLRKILVLILLTIAAAFSQTVLVDENFEGTWPPTGWEVLHLGNEPNCQWRKTDSVWWENSTYFAGIFQGMEWYWANEWILSPWIDLDNLENIRLRYRICWQPRTNPAPDAYLGVQLVDRLTGDTTSHGIRTYGFPGWDDRIDTASFYFPEARSFRVFWRYVSNADRLHMLGIDDVLLTSQTGVEEVPQLPCPVFLEISPNPFRQTTQLRISSSSAKFALYSSAGRVIGELSPDDWDGQELPSGSYFLVLETSTSHREVRKVVKLE